MTTIDMVMHLRMHHFRQQQAQALVASMTRREGEATVSPVLMDLHRGHPLPLDLDFLKLDPMARLVGHHISQDISRLQDLRLVNKAGRQ